MELLRPLVDEVSRDRFGNLIGVRRCGKENAKRVVLDAHLDEVGLVITGAKDGFLRFRPVGGIDPRMLPDRELTILSDPPCFGLVAVLLDGRVIEKLNCVAAEDVPRPGFIEGLLRILRNWR